MKKTKQPRLKPCPFCGGKANIRKMSSLWRVGCIDEYGFLYFNCPINPYTLNGSERKSVKDWNKRA